MSKMSGNGPLDLWVHGKKKVCTSCLQSHTSEEESEASWTPKDPRAACPTRVSHLLLYWLGMYHLISEGKKLWLGWNFVFVPLQRWIPPPPSGGWIFFLQPDRGDFFFFILMVRGVDFFFLKTSYTPPVKVQRSAG